MQTYPFLVDALCWLANGETQTLRRLPVSVEAYSNDEARGLIKGVAVEYIGDRGSSLTDAPVLDVDILEVWGDK